MAQPVMQASFHAGEWAPALNARVDLAKYRSGAALMRNFFVDYRGGASTRPGTRYVLHCFKPTQNVRLIPFQASFEISFMLEFGDFYMRPFVNGGAPVLEDIKAIAAISNSNVATLTVNAHGYQIGDWVYLAGASGMSEINGRYFKIGAINFGPNNFSIQDLFGNYINSIGFGTYTGSGSSQRVFTLATPYSATQIDLLKYAQNVDFMVICHPDHDPYTLTFNGPTNWTLVPITFGTTVSVPTGVVASTTVAGAKHFSYRISAVDANGQESTASPAVDITINEGPGTSNTVSISWTAVSGATSYNIYRAGWNTGAPMPIGSAFGLVANITGTQFIDNFSVLSPSNPADYSLTPVIVKSPFLGGEVTSITVTSPGTYTTAPGVTLGPPAVGGAQATAQASLGATSIAFSSTLGTMAIGDIIIPWDQVTGNNPIPGGYGGLQLRVTGLDGLNQCNAAIIVASGSVITVPGNPIHFRRNLLPGQGGFSSRVLFNVTWGVKTVSLTAAGAGYVAPPTVTFAPAGATATAAISAGPGGVVETGNPTVPIFFQQRLVLAGPTDDPQRFNMSQPGSYFNFNESDPIQPDDAIEGFLVSGQLNSIKSMVGMSSGLIMFSDKQAWLIKAGDDSGVTPINIVAKGQAYNGASDLPPIVVNYDVLYVQSKGSIVRDLTYNFYTDIYTGTDVTVVSSHLFYGHTIKSWAYAEEPYKVLWAVRDDGILLSLTFLKEQELVGWAHSDTPNDFFRSVGSIVEETITGTVDALYLVVERQGFRYIERMVERTFAGPSRVADAWCVDSGLRYVGAPASTFRGAEHLRGRAVTGLADGNVITTFIMPLNGVFTLPAPASKVTIGLLYGCALQTLALDLGEPTVQGKRKKITGVTLRVQDTLGLYIGRSGVNATEMKDLKIGNLGSMTNEVVTDLVTGDARTNVDPLWDVPGQYVILQSLPYPATILGVIPEINVGDSPK